MGNSVTFTAVAGTTYYIAVDGRDGDFGDAYVGVAQLGDPGGAVLPAGAVGMLDFVHGHYIYGATTYTADQVVTQPWRIVPNVGLVGGGQERFGMLTGAICQILSPFSDYLFGGSWTVVVEWCQCVDGFTPFWLAGDIHAITGGWTGNTVFVESDNTYPFVSEYFATTGIFGPERDIYFTDPGAPIQPVTPAFGNCLAWTRTDARAALSFNGNVVQTNENSQPSFASANIDHAFIGDSIGITARIVIYPPQLDADLPTLSSTSSRISTRPSNDSFANAATVTVGTNIGPDCFNPTAEVGEPDHFQQNYDYSGAGVWFKFTAPETRDYQIDNFGSQVPQFIWLGIAVYIGNAVNALTRVGGWPTTYRAGTTMFNKGINDPDIYPLDQPWYSKFTLSALAGTTYYMVMEPETEDFYPNWARCVLNITPA